MYRGRATKCTSNSGIAPWLRQGIRNNFGFCTMLIRAGITRRVFKGMSISLCIILILAFAGLQLLQKRFSQELQYLVERRSHGTYLLEIGEANLSLWEGKIKIREARLYCRDTAGVPLWINVQVPNIYFSLGSWRALLFQRELIIDSISIINPVVEIVRAENALPSSPPQSATGDILPVLRRTFAQLRLRSFALTGGRFTVRTPTGIDLFRGEDITLAAHDLGGARDGAGNGARSGAGNSSRGGAGNRGDDGTGGSPASGSIVLSLGAQHWISQDKKQSLEFSRLHLDSRSHTFQLDSFRYSRKADNTHNAFNVEISQLYCVSHRLADSFWRGRFELDTLVCVRPVMMQPSTARQHSAKEGVPELLRQDIFNPISLHFVKVIGGRMAIGDSTQHRVSFYGQAVNLRMYGCQFDRFRSFPLSTDSISIDLKKLEFLSRDSGYKLSVGEFGIQGQDLWLRQVKFQPVQKAVAGSPVPQAVAGPPVRQAVARSGVFSAPQLLLRNIDIGLLLKNQLSASSAELDQPRITLIDSGKLEAPASRGGPPGARKNAAPLYRTLHNIKELIDAPVFRIKDGMLQYVRAGISPVEATVSGLNASIWLNRIFVSGNLMDIKRAIPDWSIDSFHLTTKTSDLTVVKYRLAGDRLYSRAGRIQLSTGNGWRMNGEDVFYSGLDWDLFQTAGIIRIDSLHIGKLALSGENRMRVDQRKETPAPLPNLHLRMLQVDSLSFQITRKGMLARCAITNIRISGLQPVAEALQWDRATASISDLSYRSDTTQITAREGAFDSEQGLQVRRAEIGYGSGGARFKAEVPFLSVSGGIHSTETTGLHGISVAIPAAGFQFSSTTAKDTFRIEGRAKLSAAGMDVSPFVLARAGLNIDDASIEYRSQHAGLTIKRLFAVYRDSGLTRNSFANPEWIPWVQRVSINAAGIQLSTEKLHVDIGALRWAPADRVVDLSDFTAAPREGRDGFFRGSRWQNDFIYVSGRRITLQGAVLSGQNTAPKVTIREMDLDGIWLNASRDKHIPFHHGLEKKMPTKLISKLPLDISIDTTRISSSHIGYDELSVLTNRWSHISLDGLSGIIANIHSRDNSADSLIVDVSSGLLGGSIRRFQYHESYGDSLSGFIARASYSPFELSRLSAVSMPAAAVQITDGYVDTAWSVWFGNANAAYGSMDFHYRQLQIRVLNRQDSLRRGVLPALETFVTKIILRQGSEHRSVIFYQRDKEKFIFNYWVRTQASGIVSALLRRRSVKYRKEYSQRHSLYFLPGDLPTYFETW